MNKRQNLLQHWRNWNTARFFFHFLALFGGNYGNPLFVYGQAGKFRTAQSCIENKGIGLVVNGGLFLQFLQERELFFSGKRYTVFAFIMSEFEFFNEVCKVFDK